MYIIIIIRTSPCTGYVSAKRGTARVVATQQGHDGSVGGALDRKAKRNADAGSSLRCDKGFFSHSQFSVQTLLSPFLIGRTFVREPSWKYSAKLVGS